MNQSVINEIKNTNKTIDDNIANKDYLNRGLLSQNILGQLRTLVEDVIVLWYNKKYNKNFTNSFEDKKYAYEQLEARANPAFLNDFHRFLQASKSHYTPNYHGAEFLMQKYYSFLVKMKVYVKNEFGIDILINIKDYPLKDDVSFQEYYEKISDIIDSIGEENKNIEKARYYVEKINPIYIDNKVKNYYEITLSSASDKINKFDRIIAYTTEDILPNYAIQISTIEKEIELFSAKTTIRIINDWKVAIRSCEINNMSQVFNVTNETVKDNMVEYKNLMNYLTLNKINLLNIVLMPEDIYNEAKKNIGVAPTGYIFNLFERCRKIIFSNFIGAKTVRYLLLTMNNRVIKKQLNKKEKKLIPLNYMSNLCLKAKCYPFEKLPFVMSLAQHNPSGDNLFLSQNSENCDDQLLARHVLNNVEQRGILYTPVDDLKDYGDIDNLISTFNSKLLPKQYDLFLVKEHNNVFMKGYEESALKVINKINDMTNNGIDGYEASFAFWEKNTGFSTNISDKKKEILRKIYSKSRVALIYGAAGTGKTTIINSLSEYFALNKKIFLTNTNTALENLKRRVNVSNSVYYTIAEFNSNDYLDKDCDVLIIDECSTVSNYDIVEILQRSNYKLLLLVGDIYQIESIRFGNWFYLCKNFINSNSVYELTKPFRSDDEHLLELWNKIRNFDDKITEYMVKCEFSSKLDATLFNKIDDEEVILCLGYDGLYGINQINKYLQDYNPNPKFNFGIKTYKVGDKILFFEIERFKKVLYNNLKGTINEIIEDDKSMYFKVEVEKPITELEVMESNVDLIETKKESAIIGFRIDKEFENDDDDDDKNNIVPFNIAYALSIHKAQGLEYNSVKVVITKDVENMISPNIFYTAVTRAKKHLKVFWTEETAEFVIEQIKNSNNNRDYNIFKNKYELNIKSHITS